MKPAKKFVGVKFGTATHIDNCIVHANFDFVSVDCSCDERKETRSTVACSNEDKETAVKTKEGSKVKGGHRFRCSVKIEENKRTR